MVEIGHALYQIDGPSYVVMHDARAQYRDPQVPTARLRTDAPKLTCPPYKAQVYYTDSETPRLRLRVARSGRHVWDWRSVAGTDVLGVYDPAGVAGLSYAEAKRLADHRNALLNRGASVETAVVLPEPVRTVEDMLRYHIKEKLTEETWERREKETRRGAESAIRPLVARYGHLLVEEFTSHHLLHAVRAAGLANRTAGQKLPGLNWSSQRQPEPLAAPRQRPRRAFSTQGSCEVWC